MNAYVVEYLASPRKVRRFIVAAEYHGQAKQIVENQLASIGNAGGVVSVETASMGTMASLDDRILETTVESGRLSG